MATTGCVPGTVRRIAAAAAVVTGLTVVTATLPAGAADRPANAINLARLYFADLGAHRYTAAARLEVPCSQLVIEHASGSAAVSSTLLRGREPVSQEARRLSFVRWVHVERIRGYMTPVLVRYHMAGFDVSGHYQFVHAGGPRGATASHYPSGFYHIHVIARRCGNTWGIDPEWLEGSPGDFAGGICKQRCNIVCDAEGCRRVWR